ncbi:capsule biosynthesis protein [Celeribacter sp.]|uniref:capsule biosynthesis protein n=1 Tax=Celeribacter sp. TaxID=1890673 RepID=UPI003A8DAC60
MTTKPKVQKYRVRRGPRTAAQSPAAQASLQAAAAQAAEDAEVVQERVRKLHAANTPANDTSKAPAESSKEAPLQGDSLFDNGSADDGFGDGPFPGSAAAEKAQPSRRAARPHGGVAAELAGASTAKTGDVTPADETSIDAEIDAIRREGLTGRQLRMARRVANKHGLAPTSDFDAIRLLRKQGIDPFQKGTMLDLVETGKGNGGGAGLPAHQNPQLPKTVDQPALPSAAVLERIAREDDISTIQRDIAKRRRRKMLLLVARLAVFVFLPTAFAGYYFYNIATPMYATDTSMVIKQAQSPSSGSGLGSMLSGSPLGTSQEAVTVQDYLLSKDAMLRLDADVGFKDHFASEEIDPLQRLPENPSNEEAYKVYQDRVMIGYDPTEGILKMEVVAADPQVSKQFSEALIKYAEERMDQLTQRIRDDQMSGARESLDEAEAKMSQAQEDVVKLQEQMGIISPDAETSALMSQINGFETQLQQKRLQLQQLLDNSRPNQARVEGVQGDIGRLEALISDLRNDMTEAQRPAGSLARITAQLRMAEVELQTRQAMVQQALMNLESARTEVNRQISYLSTGVSPVAPEDPNYPRKFENTLLALLMFSGLYLLASLTAAVLREQVSA